METAPDGSEDQLYNRYIPHLVLSGINDAVVPRNFAEITGMPLWDVEREPFHP